MNTPSGGRIEFKFGHGERAAQAVKAPEGEITVLVLSDLSGRLNRGVLEPLSTRKRLPITIDNQEKVFASLGAALNLGPASASEPKVQVRIQALEDFHPDRLLKRLVPLTAVFEAMTDLGAPAKIAEAANRLQGLLSAGGRQELAEHRTPVEAEPSPPGASESDHATLERLLGKAGQESSAGRKQGVSSPVEGLIRQALESTNAVTPATSATVEGLRAAAELELSSRLRRILHDPQFQALEAAWLGVDFLLRRCPDEERIHLSILDVTLDELSGDLDGLRRLLQDAPPKLILCNQVFGRSEAELEALGKLAALCSELGARLLGGAHPLLAGCDGFDRQPDPDDWRQAPAPEVMRRWAALRESPQARSIGLALPRFLLRQPYGKGSDPIEGFSFEEVVAATEHEAFLWGNPAFLCTQVIAQSVVAEAEGMDVAAGLEVDGLPVFRYKSEDGESAMKPCAEAWLVDRAAEYLLRRGFTPVLSIKGRDAVRLPGLVSVSKQGHAPTED